MQFLGGITPQEFLDNYWEKKPLLIKNAVSDIEEYASGEDLKELAFDESFETRIITLDNNQFEVKDGPLTEADFSKDKWTLACHNLNLLDSSFHNLEKAVSFIPTWLFDDIMATYSNADSSIGAHIDKYNVFILQGSGKRKWELEINPNHEYQQGLPLKILKEFNPTIEWILEPGDMIYIPSSVAHKGTSLTESISYSIGFKSLEDQIILDKYLVDCLDQIETEEYLKNTFTKIQEEETEVPETLINHFHQKVSDYLTNKEQFKNWFLSFLTTPKEEIEKGVVLIEEEVLELASNNILMRDLHSRLNSFKEDDEYILSISKNLYRIKEENFYKVKKWFSKATDHPINIDYKNLDHELWPLLIDLIKKGIFFFEPLD